MLQVYRGAVRQPGPGEGTVTRYSPKHGGWELQVGGAGVCTRPYCDCAGGGGEHAAGRLVATGRRQRSSAYLTGN